LVTSPSCSEAIYSGHFWKGFGALAGAYIFAALATRGFARYEDHRGLPVLLGRQGRSVISNQ
jgi:hypothetical protein